MAPSDCVRALYSSIRRCPFLPHQLRFNLSSATFQVPSVYPGAFPSNSTSALLPDNLGSLCGLQQLPLALNALILEAPDDRLSNLLEVCRGEREDRRSRPGETHA